MNPVANDVRTLIDKLLQDTTSPDTSVQEDARLILWFLLEYNRKDIGSEDITQYYSNYLPAILMGKYLGLELEQYIVQNIADIIVNVDNYRNQGLFIIIEHAPHFTAVDALLSLMLTFPDHYDSEVARQAINCLLNLIYDDDFGSTIPEIVALLQTKNPSDFLIRVISDQQNQEAVWWASYALKQIELYLKPGHFKPRLNTDG